MDNRFGNQSPLRNPAPLPLSSSGNYSATDPQTLEATFSRLSLASTSQHHNQPPFLRRDFGGVESVLDYSIGGGEGSLPFSFQIDADLHRLTRVQSAMNGQMGFDFGGTHKDPTVGPGSWDVFQGGSYPTATSQPWQRDDGMDFSGGFDQINGGYFLQPKKQLGNRRNSQLPIVPCATRSLFSVDSDHHFDGFGSMNSSNMNSQRLRQFPSNSNPFSLEKMRGQIVTLAKDQYGSRLLQTKFEDPKQEEIDMVLLEVIDHVGELMTNQFGNYIIQKLVKVCNEKQRTLIILAMTKAQFQLITICLNPHGTRVVQRLLEQITCQQQISLVLSAINPGAVVLATDPNGHHVIQHCLIHFSNEDNKCILTQIVDNCFKIATNKHGCCVLQSCVEHFQGEYREHLVAEIIANALHLAEDPFGNYVVQHLLGLKIPGVIENLVMQLQGSFVSLSCNKYGSNVVEKCLTESREEESTRVLMELIRSPNVCRLLVDPFGNFVIQSALSVSKGIVRHALLNIIHVNSPSLRNNLYGKKVLDRFDKMKPQHVGQSRQTS